MNSWAYCLLQKWGVGGASPHLGRDGQLMLWAVSSRFELAWMQTCPCGQRRRPNVRRQLYRPSIRCLLDPSTPEKRRHDGVIKQKGNGRPLVKAPSFAFKAPAVYHMNKIITCLLHLDHFKRPSSPPARTHACVRVGAILSRGYEYAGL